MKRLALSVIALCVVLLAVAEAISVFPPIWPMPQQFSNGSETLRISSRLTLAPLCNSSTDLTEAFDRFLSRTFYHSEDDDRQASPLLKTVSICMWSVDAPLQLNMPERYTLAVTHEHVTITCDAVYGCYHALETLSQMIWYNFDSHAYYISHAPWLIDDFPRFAHRGMLIDTSRHFLPLATLRHVVDSLSYAKFNVMHWHIVDWQAYPLESQLFPRLAQKGAFSSMERYTMRDVKEIVNYAGKRGLRVMLEFDTPGHTAAMCNGMPELCPVPLCAADEPHNWALDPTRELTYTVVEDLFREMASLFPEQMVHIGGDEVDLSCWSQRPYIVQWFADRNMTLHDGFEQYVKRVERFVSGALDRVVVGWEELWSNFGSKLDKRTVVQQWIRESPAFLRNVTSQGYRALVSPASRWYLDRNDTTWEHMYTLEPCTELSSEQCSLVIGGEACHWSEFVDASVELNNLWPRAAAVAERLWSAETVKSTKAAKNRYAGFRCILNNRGIPAGPAFNNISRSAPDGPASCYEQ